MTAEITAKDTIVGHALHAFNNNRYTANKIISLYAEKHRKYHNIDHIAFMCAKASWKNYDLDHPIWQLILMHDIVYYPQSKINEELSAAYYRYIAREVGAVYDDEDEVVAGILASKNHTDKNNGHLSIWIKDFLDFDLIAMADKTLYKINSYKIWHEFSATTDPGDFINGRRRWLESMLLTTRIYWNALEAEGPTRANIMEEYSALCEDKYSIARNTNMHTLHYFYGEDYATYDSHKIPEWAREL